jgi:hypothetical protein
MKFADDPLCRPQGGNRTSRNPITSSMTERVLYESSNGDAWFLARDPASKMPVVRHQPNLSSGGQVSYTAIGKFLRDGVNGPEHRALLDLIATLIDD